LAGALLALSSLMKPGKPSMHPHELHWHVQRREKCWFRIRIRISNLLRRILFLTILLRMSQLNRLTWQI
jgi:hypothetical protein